MFVNIDKNISVPVSISGRGRPAVWPFRHMNVGNSFVVAADQVDAVRVAASSYGRRNGMRFTVRTLPDGSARCWRVESAREAPATQRAPRGRTVVAVGAPVRAVDGVPVYADQHGVEYAPLDDLLNATLKIGSVRLALDKLASIAEIHPAKASGARFAALLGQIRGALVGDGAESLANALEPPQAPPLPLERDDDPI